MVHGSIEFTEDSVIRSFNADDCVGEDGLDANLLRHAQSFNFSHPNIVKVKDVRIDYECLNVFDPKCKKAQLIIVSERGHMDLARWLDEELGSVKASDVMHVANDILQGLRFLHAHGFVHSKLTAENIIMFETEKRWVAKIGDFYDMQIVTGDLPTSRDVNYAAYTAPEIVEGTSGYTFASDIWSYGILLFRICYGSAPFHTLHQVYEWIGAPSSDALKYAKLPKREISFAKRVKNNFQGKWEPIVPVKVVSKLLPIMDQCVSVDAICRPTARELMRQGAFVQPTVPGKTRKGGKASAYPPLKNDRDRIVSTIQNDCKIGMACSEVVPHAIQLFDRVSSRMRKHDPDVVFATCYLLAMKLTVHPSKLQKDNMDLIRGAVVSVDKTRRLIVMFEREIVDHLNFNLLKA